MNHLLFNEKNQMEFVRLDQAQSVFLEILCSAVQGKSHDLHMNNAAVLPEVLRMASVQHVLPMIYEAIYQSELMRRYPELFAMCKKRIVDEVVSQTVRTAQFLDLYRKLDGRGLRPLVVKGIAVRRFYPREELRSSVDEDLLIPPEMRDSYHEALLDYGMEQMKEERDIEEESEISYRHPGTGLYLEVHQHLFPPESHAYGDLNRFFEDRETEEFEYRGQKMLTLNPTDHLFFLICHSFKHFLHSGFGIRQICDMVILSNMYADVIDWEKIWRQCGEIRGQDFLRAMYRIGNQYLLKENRYSVYLKNWDIDSVDELPLLLDVLASGVHGAADMTRLHSSNMTLKAMENYKNSRNSKSSVWSSAFLPLKDMKKKYRYLEKAPFLLPAAWLQRILQYARELSSQKSSGNNVMDSISLGRKRVELLKKYGVIK